MENFCSRNPWFLDNYADEAISRFGPGEGIKPDVDAALHRYWSLERRDISRNQPTRYTHVRLGSVNSIHGPSARN